MVGFFGKMEKLSYKQMEEIRANALIELYASGSYDAFTKLKEAETAMKEIDKSEGVWNRRSQYGNYHHPLFKD